MDSPITETTVVISTSRKYLSAEELASHHRDSVEPLLQSAPKQAKRCAISDLERAYAKLRLSISAPRIERVGGRSLAVWDVERGMARVTRIEGKFHTFGSTHDQQLYLDYFEALFLLETERLQLEYYGRKVSIEQAYVLLLGEESSPKYCEYLVYAYLTRAGYVITRHKNKRFYPNLQATEKDCIWAWLFNAIENVPVPNNIKKTQTFANVKRQIDTIKGSIIDQRYSQEASEPPTPCSDAQNETAARDLKRKHDDDADPSYSRKYFFASAQSFLDLPTTEPEYKKFANIFSKLDIVKLRPMRRAVPDQFSATNNDKDDDDEDGDDDNDSDFEDTSDAIEINFDLYTHQSGFKKSAPKPPLMRVIVLSASKSFPNHRQMSLCSRKLLRSTPILVVSVGSAKQIQAFLYYFTT